MSVKILSCIFLALKLLTKKENLPAVFCCTIGKDRTGVLAALILHILGHSEQTIETEQLKSAVSKFDFV